MPRFSSLSSSLLTSTANPPDILFQISTALSRVNYLTVKNLSAAPMSLQFSANGLDLFVLEQSGRITQYTLARAFDLGMVSAVRSLLPGIGEIYDFWISEDGLRMYLQTVTTIRQYSLSTPWSLVAPTTQVGTARNISTAVFGGSETQIWSLQWWEGGGGFTILGRSTNRVYNIAASTAWDQDSTLTLVGSSLATAATDSQPTEWRWMPGGQTGYLIGDTNDRVYVYTGIATPYRFTGSETATANLITSVATVGTANPQSLTFNDTGSRAYVLFNGSVGSEPERVVEYRLGTVYRPDTGSHLARNYRRLTVTGATGEHHGVAWRNTGLNLYIVNATNRTFYQFTLSRAWDITTATQTTARDFIGDVRAFRALHVRDTGTDFWVLDATNRRIEQWQMDTPWSGANITAVANSPAFTAQETAPTGLFIDSTGTRVYITGESSRRIHQYSLTTPWDISTLTYVATSGGAQFSTNISDLHIDSEGRRFWLADRIGTLIRQYTMTTPWDITAFTETELFDYQYLGTSCSDLEIREDGQLLTLLFNDTNDVVTVGLGPPAVNIQLTSSISGGTDEGITENFTVATQGVRDGTVYQWYIDDEHSLDLEPSSGTVTVNSDTAAFSSTVAYDFLVEGEESFTVSLAKPTGSVVAELGPLAISDTAAAVFTVGSTAQNQGFEWSTAGGLEFEVSITSGSAPDGYTLYWSTDNPSLFTSGSGSFNWNSGFGLGLFTVTPIEGQSGQFTVSVRRDSVTGPVLTTSAAVTLRDYAITVPIESVDEGDDLTVTVTVTGDIPNGTVRYWTIEDSAADFAVASGSFTITDQVGQFTVTPTADETTEGNDSFRVAVRTGSTVGPILETSASIVIVDTSTGSPTYSVATHQSVYSEGQNVIITLTTTNVLNNSTVYWNVDPQTADLSPNSGTMTVISNTAQVTIAAVSDGLSDSPEVFNIRVRTEEGGTLLASSPNFTVIDAAPGGTGL